jgi:hypothetical protein
VHRPFKQFSEQFKVPLTLRLDKVEPDFG